MQFPFVVFALPRSRTAWLAAWLSKEQPVSHDLAPFADSCQDFLDALYPLAGTVETGAQDAHDLLRLAMPSSKFVTIRRPVDEVEHSLAAFGVADQHEELLRRDAVLDQVEAAGARSIPYHWLTDPRVCADLWEHLFATAFDWNWWRYMDAKNVQIDVTERLEILGHRQVEIAKIKQEIVDLSKGLPKFTRIGWEPFASLWVDAEQLAFDHSAEVNAGERFGHPFKLDVDAILKMEQARCFHAMSARINGRLVGYLTWSISPDLESVGVVIADQGGWYVDPSAPKGIGRKMLDKSIVDLRAIGVQSIQIHHQLHGRGARLGALYKRMGAIEHQHRFTLWIGE